MRKRTKELAITAVVAAVGGVILYELFKPKTPKTPIVTTTTTQGTSGLPPFIGLAEAPGMPWTHYLVPGTTYSFTLRGPSYVTGTEQASLLGVMDAFGMGVIQINGPDSAGSFQGRFVYRGVYGQPSPPPNIPRTEWIAIWSSTENVYPPGGRVLPLPPYMPPAPIFQPAVALAPSVSVPTRRL